MAQESGTYTSVLDTLALVHEQKTAQFNANCALQAELADGERRLARLESLYTSLLESLPDLGVSPEQSEQEPAPDDTEPTPDPEPESQQPNASEEAAQNSRPSLPDGFKSAAALAPYLAWVPEISDDSAVRLLRGWA